MILGSILASIWGLDGMDLGIKNEVEISMVFGGFLGGSRGEPRAEETASGEGERFIRGSGGETTEGGYSIAANKKTPWT